MKSVSISNSELEVMKLLWERAPLSGPELIEQLRSRCDRDENTIKTLLFRLVKKGAVRQDGRRRNYTYTPAIDRDDYRKEAGGRLIEQVFDSSPAAMMCFFAQREKLSAADIAELKTILEQAEQK
jgi:predicted transcriptional regulator